MTEIEALRAKLDDVQADLIVLQAILSSTAFAATEPLSDPQRDALFSKIQGMAIGQLLRPEQPLPPTLELDRAEAARRVLHWLAIFRRCAGIRPTSRDPSTN